MLNPKIVGAATAVAVGILLLTLGVWQTLVILLLGAGGYIVGKWAQGEIPRVDVFLETFFHNRRQKADDP